MEKFDWLSTFGTNLKMLRLVGLWPENPRGYKCDYYTLYALVCINLCLNGPNFTQIMDIYFYSSDLETLTARIFLTLSELLVPIKTYYHVKNISTVKELVEKINRTIFQPKTTSQRNLVQFQLKIWKVAYSAFCCSSFAAVIFIFTFPIFDGSYKEHRLPMSAWFPFDFKSSPYYQMTYLYQTVAISVLVVADLNMDMFVVALIVFIGVQCDILCDDLKNNVSEPKFCEKFLRCIIHHKEILSFTENANNCYEMVIFWQIFTSSLAIALTMFQLTLVSLSFKKLHT